MAPLCVCVKAIILRQDPFASLHHQGSMMAQKQVKNLCSQSFPLDTYDRRKCFDLLSGGDEVFLLLI